VKTIKAAVTGELSINKSKFMAMIFPVTSKTAFLTHLAALKTEYFDATHIVYAVRISKESFVKVFESSEPHHTSGQQLFNLIKQQELDNIAIFVIRYFGGTKLGVGPLMRAYYQVAKKTLAKGDLTSIVPLFRYQLEVRYEHLAEVLLILKDTTIIKREHFDDYVRLGLTSETAFSYVRHATLIKD
jgi:putative IMPACT (imprinted ancient) family translation regulator